MKKTDYFENAASSSFIWDTKPASDWAEAYPISNGRLGAMVYCDSQKEMVALNHDRLWRSYLKSPEFQTYQDMPEIKELAMQNRWAEAEKLLEETVAYTGNAIYINPFVPAFDLYLNMALPSENITEYRRGLDMRHGVVCTEFVSGDIRYHRTSFCSYDSGVVVMHLTASAPGRLTGEVSLSRILDPECSVTGDAGYGYLTISAAFEEGRKFGGAVRILHKNGRITMGKRTYGTENEEMPEKKFGLEYVFDRDTSVNFSRGPSFYFDSCDEVTLIIGIAVDDETDDPVSYCMEKTGKTPAFSEMEQIHRKHFSSFYDRVCLRLGADVKPEKTTPMRIQEALETGVMTAFMTELMYNAARYIAIASGMPQPEGAVSKAPINLQGIWNRDTRPAWDSDYHTDLNIEMCYWPLVSAGLIEWYEPYLEWIERLSGQARQRAKQLYGAGGIAFNGCCDPNVLGNTDNVGATWLTATAWLMQILWIYYEHDMSDKLLKRIYPVFLSAAEFLEEMLVEEEGKLTYPFGASPEMGLIEDGKIQWLSSASTIDLSLTKELFAHVMTAAQQLEKPQTAEKYAKLLEKIRELPIDEEGCITEWTQKHEETEPGHRHRSPWVSFCPGSYINKRSMPDVCDGLEKLLARRLAAGKGASTSFSFAWDAQIMARYGRSQEAFERIYLLLPFMLDNMMMATNDYENKGYGIPWFPGHKVMQVDAQICLISAIAELFYQDSDGVITPLAALPSELETGSMTGIAGRNGFVTDIYWENHKLTSMKIYSRCGKNCRICVPKGQKMIGDPGIEEYRMEGEVLSFDTIAGKEYVIKFT